MKKIIFIYVKFMLFIFVIFSVTINAEASTMNPNSDSNKTESYKRVMKQDILCIMAAYKDYIVDLNYESNGKVFLITNSGKKILYDDLKAKNFEGKLANPDIQDMMEQIYPLSHTSSIMEKNFDPGRIRCYNLLSEVYGGSRSDVEKKLGNVNVGGRRYQFNKSNRASQELNEVMKELSEASRKSPKLSSFIYPSSGTFNYRQVAGTGRLSPHAFGIAIDLSRDKRDYWQWASRKEGEERLKTYPKELVEIFERHNFVWGGKWSHFDILHFEYRPEILCKGRWFGNHYSKESMWYEGSPINDDYVKNCIELIEKKLGEHTR